MNELLEEYNFNYDLFLAEQELFNSMINFGYMAIEESAGLMYLEEGIKETVTTYITKISTALQKLWDNVKEKFIDNKENKSYFSKIADKITSKKINFTVKNLPNYDIQAIDNIKIVDFNYEELKDYLDTKEHFIEHSYPDLYSKMKQEDKSLKEVITKIGIPSLDENEQKVDSSMIKNMLEFCSKKFNDSMSKLGDDLKKFNNNNQTIINSVSTIVPAEAPQEACMFYESVLLEVDENKDNKTMTIKDDENEKSNNAGYVKNVSNFISVNTDIITTKMNIYCKAYRSYSKILFHWISPKKEENKEETNNNNQETQTKTNVNV